MGQAEDIPSGFAEAIGTEWIDFDPDNARARIAVEKRHLQDYIKSLTRPQRSHLQVSAG